MSETKRLFSATACILPEYKVVEVVAIDYHAGKLAYTLDPMDGDLIGHWVPMDQVVWIKQGNNWRPQT